VHRAIPPDSAHANLPAREGAQHREAIGDLHFAADHFAGAIETYNAALASLVDESPEERCRLLLRLALAYYQRGDFDASLTSLRTARATARPVGDPHLNARIAAEMAHTLTAIGQYRRARRYALHAYRTLRNTDDHRTVAQAGVSIGLCYARLGAASEAIEWLQNAAATFRRIDDADGLVTALNNLGLVYKNLREWREATRFLEQALKIDERAGLYARMRAHNQNLGLIRYYLGQWDLAEENFRRSLQISRDTGHQQGEAQALLAIGRLARRRRQLERAEEQFDRALELADRVGAQREVALAREFLAEVALDRGHPIDALALLEPALEDARQSAPQGDLTMELENRVGQALLHLGRIEDAQGHLLHGLALAERLGDRLEQAVAERSLARLAALQGNSAGMEMRIRAAAQSLEELNESYELAVTLASWGELLLLLPAGQRLRVPLEPVADAARRASVLFRELGVLPLAADAMLTLARLEAEREHFDQAVSMLEQAEQWLREAGDAETEGRASTLRRELEQQYVAISLSSCNEFRALEEANRLFRDTSDMDGLLAQAVKLAVEHSGGDRGFVAFSATGGRLDVVAQHGLGRDRARRILQTIEGMVGHRTGSGPLFSSRVSADPRFSGALSGALESVGSLVCVPLNFPSQAVGLVYVDRFSDSLLGAFKQRELNLLAVLANSAGVAIVEAQRSLLLQENQVLRQQLKPTPGMERVISQSREMSEILTLM
jgi:tetratricopeptide (TPR) repeat protein